MLIYTGRHAVDLLARTCSCGRFQHDGVPFRAIHRSVRTVPAFRAIYTAPMPLVEIAGLQSRDDMICQAPVFKKARGRPLKLPALLLESREHELLLSMGPYGTFRSAFSAAPAVTKPADL